MKNDRNAAERALERVVTEARSHGSPTLDWERIEARLDEAPRMPDVLETPSRGLRSAVLLAAAAVLLLVGWFAAGGRTPIALPTTPDARPQALDGNALGADSRVDANKASVNVEHAGHSRWTLVRGGQARVTALNGVVRVELEQGALVAQVVPSPRKETFVVEAAGTRVAVHGTAFRVELVMNRVDVFVAEGTVLVGPRSAPGTGRALSANERSSFTLSGAPLADEPSARAPSRRPAVDRRGMPNVERPRELPEQPSIDEVEKVVNQVNELGTACFQRHTSTENGVRVTASTMVTLRALPNGRLELAGLEPPLAPQAQGCLAEGIQKLAIAESQRGIPITRRLELER